MRNDLYTCIAPGFAPSGTSAGKSIFPVQARKRIAAILRLWAKRYRQRQTVNQLMTLSDHTLKDIGLSRSEIASAVYHPHEAPIVRFESAPRRHPRS